MASSGMQQFEGQASVREALAFYDKAARAQGTKMNYHSTDTLALSVLVEEIAGSPLSHFFYNNLYQKFGQSGYMHWTSDKNGSKYGYQSWVFPVNGRPTLTLQGHGGQFMVLDEKNDTILLTISINEEYKAGNLFSYIGKFTEKLNKSGNWN